MMLTNSIFHQALKRPLAVRLLNTEEKQEKSNFQIIVIILTLSVILPIYNGGLMWYFINKIKGMKIWKSRFHFFL